jgi:hypothetical protein
MPVIVNSMLPNLENLSVTNNNDKSFPKLGVRLSSGIFPQKFCLIEVTIAWPFFLHIESRRTASS